MLWRRKKQVPGIELWMKDQLNSHLVAEKNISAHAFILKGEEKLQNAKWVFDNSGYDSVKEMHPFPVLLPVEIMEVMGITFWRAL